MVRPETGPSPRILHTGELQGREVLNERRTSQGIHKHL